MKQLLTVIALNISLLSFGQQAVNWGPEIIVSDGSLYGNFRPRATIVGNDIPVVIYGRNGNENVFISKWNGTAFDTPIAVIPTGQSAYAAGWTGPDIDSHGDTIIAVFKLNPIDLGNVYSVRSTDGGLTFSDTIRVDSHDTGVAWMPSMGMDDNGNPVVTSMIHDANWANPRYVVSNSTDGGLSYNGENEIASGIGGEACDCCPAEMIVDGQNQVLLFRNNDVNIRDIFGVLSTDGGTTFPSATNIDNTNWFISGCPATGPDGLFMGDKLYTVYASAGEGITKVYLSSSSTTTGLTYETREITPSPTPINGVQNFPRISGENDTIVMAWMEVEGGNTEIYYSVSVPGVNHMHALSTYKYKANLTTSGVQTNPEIIYKNGFVHLFYQDDSSGDVIYRRGTIDVDLGIDELTQSTLIYPNPSHDGIITIKGATNGQVSVTDALGRNIEFERKTEAGNTLLKISNPKPGVYFLKLATGKTQSFTIQ